MEEHVEREESKPTSIKSIVLITLLAAIIVFACEYYGMAVMQPPKIMAGAVKGLREIGTAQLAYQAENNSKDYGSFKNLQVNGKFLKKQRRKISYLITL